MDIGLQVQEGLGRPDRRPGESDHVLGIGTACAPRRKEEVGPGFRQAEEDQSNPGRFASRVFSPDGWETSIDVTKPGIDKAYGIRKLRDVLKITLEEMIFIGDALFPGGNDYPAKEAGVVSIEVRDPTRRNGSSKRSSLVWAGDRQA